MKQQQHAQKALAAATTVAPTTTAATGGGNSEWVTISVRRSLYDLISEFVDARRDATITNIAQFADLAIRAELRNAPRPAAVRTRRKKARNADRQVANDTSTNCTQSDLNKPRGGESEI